MESDASVPPLTGDEQVSFIANQKNHMKIPLITVCIPLYNSERYIAETLDSVLAQHLPDGTMEVIVLDNASTDGSVEVVRRYLQDPRIQLITHDRQLGVTANHQFAAEQGSGRYFSWLHSDDIYLPGHLSELIGALEKNRSCCLAYSPLQLIDSLGHQTSILRHPFHAAGEYFGGRNELAELLANDNPCPHSAVVMRREALQAALPLDSKLDAATDWDLWCRMADANPNFAFLERASIGYRIHDNQDSTRYYKGIGPLHDHLRILEKFIGKKYRPRLRGYETKILSLLNQRASLYTGRIDNDTMQRLEAVRSALSDRAQILSSKFFSATPAQFITIIIPSFNISHYLPTCLHSVVNEIDEARISTGASFEIIVVDDGSTDGSESVARQVLSGRADARILAHGKNCGLAAARNTGIEAAKGEYIIFLDGDNVLHSGALRTVTERLKGTPNIDVLILGMNLIDTHGKTLGVFYGDHVPPDPLGRLQRDPFLLLANNVMDNFSAIRGSVVRQEKYDESLRRLEDWDLWIRLRYQRTCTFEILNELVGGYRLRPGQLTQEHTPRNRSFVGTTLQILAKSLAMATRIELPGEATARLLAQIQQVGEAYKSLMDLPQPVHAARTSATAPAASWHSQEHARAAEKAWAAQWGLTASRRASPAICLGIAGGAKASAANTEASLHSQWMSAKVIALPLRSTGADFLRACNAALSAVPEDWVGLVDAGDQLASDAVFRITTALHQHPEWQVIYTDEDSLTSDSQHVNPHLKPDFNLDYLRSLPYIGGLMLCRRSLFQALGGFDPEREGAEDYDLLLRAWEHLEHTGAGESAIGHVSGVLYHRAQGSGHTRKNIPEILAAGQAALQAHFDRLGIAAQVQPGPFPPSFRVRWPLPQNKPLVSILIPTRDQLPMLQRCIESVIEKTRYPAYEILIIDNDSSAGDAVRYLAAIDERKAELGDRLRVIRTPGPFNFSAMNNTAARAARGEYLLLLNNDTAALHDDWLDEMMSHAVRPDVGVVGAKLLFPDGRIQHAGVILGIRGPAEHPFIGRPPEDRGYFGRAQLVQDLSAVTGACLLVRKSVFEQVGGLDEKDLKVSYSDIDLCLKVRQAGLRVVFDPYALLMHEGSASQNGKVEQKPDEAKQARFAAERQVMYDRWLPLLARDPAYNRHLSLATTEFQLDDQACLAWDPDWRPRPRVLVHPADREGCGEYRIIAPMRALNRAGRTQGWETMRLFDPAEMERIQPDSLVVQRQMEWPQIEALERHARHSKAFRVFELDDLITNLPLKSVHRQHIHKDIAKRFRKAAGLCNRLVVATEPLRQAYADYCDEVVVCPNYLEAARWGELRPARAERSRLRVGWAGGIGHAGDLELIADVVRETASTVDWIFFGMCPDSLKDVVHEFHPGIPLDQYAPKLASLDLDLAVAPLEHNAFNEAKSHLRLLEYGVLGYPVICTDIVPYQGDFPVTRVANRFRDWTRAILDAAADPAALRAQGDALRDKVLAEWMLEDHLDTWVAAWTR